MSATSEPAIRDTPPTWLLVLGAAAGAAMLVGLALVFFYAPLESTMGVVQKIFYFHVPSAIAAYAGFFLCFAASVLYVLKGYRAADVVARAGAEVGVVFCAAVLISGPLWARKAWGAWWTGEPRLLLTLVMCLIFVAYLVVREVGGRSEITRKICAVLAILGVADIPIIRTAVSRWRGNHPQVLSKGGIDPEMMTTLLAMMVAVTLTFAFFVAIRIRIGLLEEDVDRWYLALKPRELRTDDLERPMEAR